MTKEELTREFLTKGGYDTAYLRWCEFQEGDNKELADHMVYLLEKYEGITPITVGDKLSILRNGSKKYRVPPYTDGYTALQMISSEWAKKYAPKLYATYAAAEAESVRTKPLFYKENLELTDEEIGDIDDYIVFDTGLKFKTPRQLETGVKLGWWELDGME